MSAAGRSSLVYMVQRLQEIVPAAQLVADEIYRKGITFSEGGVDQLFNVISTLRFKTDELDGMLIEETPLRQEQDTFTETIDHLRGLYVFLAASQKTIRKIADDPTQKAYEHALCELELLSAYGKAEAITRHRFIHPFYSKLEEFVVRVGNILMIDANGNLAVDDGVERAQLERIGMELGPLFDFFATREVQLPETLETQWQQYQGMAQMILDNTTCLRKPHIGQRLRFAYGINDEKLIGTWEDALLEMQDMARFVADNGYFESSDMRHEFLRQFNYRDVLERTVPEKALRDEIVGVLRALRQELETMAGYWEQQGMQNHAKIYRSLAEAYGIISDGISEGMKDKEKMGNAFTDADFFEKQVRSEIVKLSGLTTAGAPSPDALAQNLAALGELSRQLFGPQREH